MSDAEQLIEQGQRALEQGDRVNAAYYLTQALKAGADPERVDAIRSGEVEA